ncbi:aromatic acid exporter family protein [Georgenia sp. AZ-5]|uniref:FUSC family protein n=1 Tax=Georgenia sp. AZ-5 TaxID=3367526 RepID=UPI003753EFCD
MSAGRSWAVRLSRSFVRHPRAAMAVRAALAAAIAWYVAGLLPGPAAEYPYYAPMGAVIATSFTLAGSARESLQAVASIALGGVIATGAQLLGQPANPVIIALAVALAVMVAGWPRLGAMGSWVPTAALFTLVVGQGEMAYVGAYAGLVLLGALIGLAVTLVMPQVPLAPAREAVGRVRAVLTDQLVDLADALDQREPPDREEWEERRHRIRPYLINMRSAVAQAEESTRANVRARRYAAALHALRRQAHELDQAADLVRELADVLAEEETRGAEVPALGPELRPVTAEVLRRLATTLESIDDGAADAEAVADARSAVEELTRRTDATRRSDMPGGGTLAASTLILTVSRCLNSVDPARVPDGA